MNLVKSKKMNDAGEIAVKKKVREISGQNPNNVAPRLDSVPIFWVRILFSTLEKMIATKSENENKIVGECVTERDISVPHLQCRQRSLRKHARPTDSNMHSGRMKTSQSQYHNRPNLVKLHRCEIL